MSNGYWAGYTAAIVALRRRAEQRRVWQLNCWGVAADYLESQLPPPQPRHDQIIEEWKNVQQS